jgi:hypothetical protein
MKKLLLSIAAVAVILTLSKCARVRMAHDEAARDLQQSLSKVPLPKGARIIEEHSDVGGFISGTGNAIDVIAFRVFASDRTAQDVSEFFSTFLHQDTRDGMACGVFKLDRPEAPNAPVPEWCLRRMISPQQRSTFVVYLANRIDEGSIWDWRGW